MPGQFLRPLGATRPGWGRIYTVMDLSSNLPHISALLHLLICGLWPQGTGQETQMLPRPELGSLEKEVSRVWETETRRDCGQDLGRSGTGEQAALLVHPGPRAQAMTTPEPVLLLLLSPGSPAAPGLGWWCDPRLLVNDSVWTAFLQGIANTCDPLPLQPGVGPLPSRALLERGRCWTLLTWAPTGLSSGDQSSAVVAGRGARGRFLLFWEPSAWWALSAQHFPWPRVWTETPGTTGSY